MEKFNEFFICIPESFVINYREMKLLRVHYNNIFEVLIFGLGKQRDCGKVKKAKNSCQKSEFEAKKTKPGLLAMFQLSEDFYL